MSKSKKLTKAELVKIFTNVPNEFVDDFFATLDHSNSINDDFPVDINLLCKWLKTKKDTVRKTLKRSYKKDVDYTENVKPKLGRVGSGGLNSIDVMMTVDCFKRLCMRSNTKPAELVRTYFIEIDEFVTHYSDQISDGIMNDIEEVAQKIKKNPKNDGPGYIYAIRVAKGLLKLGYAKDLLSRLSVYNTGRAEDVELLYAFRTESRKGVEGCIKGLLEAKRFRKRREIYEADIDVIKKLIHGCDKMNLEILGKKEKSTQDGKYYLMFMKKGGDYSFA